MFYFFIYHSIRRTSGVAMVFINTPSGLQMSVQGVTIMSLLVLCWTFTAGGNLDRFYPVQYLVFIRLAGAPLLCHGNRPPHSQSVLFRVRVTPFPVPGVTACPGLGHSDDFIPLDTVIKAWLCHPSLANETQPWAFV